MGIISKLLPPTCIRVSKCTCGDGRFHHLGDSENLDLWVATWHHHGDWCEDLWPTTFWVGVVVYVWV